MSSILYLERSFQMHICFLVVLCHYSNAWFWWKTYFYEEPSPQPVYYFLSQLCLECHTLLCNSSVLQFQHLAWFRFLDQHRLCQTTITVGPKSIESISVYDFDAKPITSLTPPFRNPLARTSLVSNLSFCSQPHRPSDSHMITMLCVIAAMCCY